ncbi:hypothetical protein HYS47_04390 [Candidatus Woesearchaeota archaeon]|nr:hypothetical protein [Candidatus Woesearchaeota archaeon]
MKPIRFIILSIVLFSVLFPSTSAYTLLNFVKSSCYADGSFTFTIENDKPDPITIDDIQISLRHAYLSLAPAVTGGWTKSVIYENSTDPDGTKKQASFYSSAGLLGDGGDYIVGLSYYDCRDAPHCTLSFRLDNCPQYNERCELEKVTLTKCEQSDGAVNLWITGPKDVYEAVRPEFDVFYYLDMGDGNIQKLPRLTTTIDYEELELNKFKVTIPLSINAEVRRASVVKKVCDSPRHQLPELECTVQEELILPQKISQPSSPPGTVVEPVPIKQENMAPVTALIEPVSLPPQEPSLSSLPVQQVEQVQQPVQQVPVPPQPQQESPAVVQPVPTPIVVLDRPDLEKPTSIPSHFYFLVGIVVLGIVMLILSNRRSRQQRNTFQRRI